MCLEILILVYVAFKQRSGAYFWSTIMTVIGIVIYNTGNLLTNFENSSPKVFANLCWHIGWGTATTGLSLVLWSRLHLVVRNSRLLKILLIVIPFNGIVVNFVAIGVLFGLTLKYNKPYVIAVVLNYFAVISFVIIETTLSSLYIYYTVRFLKSGYSLHTRKVIGLLLCVQVLVITFDAMIWSLTFTNTLQVAVMIHPLTQAIKLKFEFIILNQLQRLVKPGGFISDLDMETGASLSAGELNPQGLSEPSTTKSLHETKSSAIAIAKVPITSPNSESDIHTVMDGSTRIELQEIGMHGRQDADEILQVEVSDKKRVARKSSNADDAIEELEAFYLGKWEDDTKA
jgi:hypothetical protein